MVWDHEVVGSNPTAPIQLGNREQATGIRRNSKSQTSKPNIVIVSLWNYVILVPAFYVSEVILCQFCPRQISSNLDLKRNLSVPISM